MRGEADQKNSTRHILLSDDILTEIHGVSVVVLSFQHGQSEAAIKVVTQRTSLCQQKVENIMPTYVHGTVMPEISDLM